LKVFILPSPYSPPPGAAVPPAPQVALVLGLLCQLHIDFCEVYTYSLHTCFIFWSHRRTAVSYRWISFWSTLLGIVNWFLTKRIWHCITHSQRS